MQPFQQSSESIAAKEAEECLNCGQKIPSKCISCGQCLPDSKDLESQSKAEDEQESEDEADS